MAVTAYAQPFFYKMDQSEILTGTFKVGLSVGAAPSRATSQGWEYLSTLVAANAELNTGGYTAVTSRITINTTGSAVSALVWTFTTSTTIQWTSQTWTTVTLAWLIYYGPTNNLTDATAPIMAYWDLGGAQSVSAGTFALTVPGGGLLTVTAAQ